MIQSSVIIPAFNNWNYTRKCLKALAANTPSEELEVIVVDNGSTDSTPKGCQYLGRQLFGDNFRYIRNEVNRNFAGASNQGAEAAAGEYLVFLNTDTEVQPGWLEPLLADFSAYSDIAATGPILAYGEETPLGKLVQHLGVFISPAYHFDHLYAGIPISSPLVRKRRFFQIITAACMVIKRELFLQVGKFDEQFVNGFEDVNLCARLGEKGYKFTVNPDSLVIHHESVTPGRHEHEDANLRLLYEKGLGRIRPDLHLLAKNDGLSFDLTAWLEFQTNLPDAVKTKLAPLLARADLAHLKELLCAYPYWEEAWEKALDLAVDPQEKIALFKLCFKLFRNPKNAFRAWEFGKKHDDRFLVKEGCKTVFAYAAAPEAHLKLALLQVIPEFSKLGMKEIAVKMLAWVDAYPQFKNEIYAPFAKKLLQVAFAEQLKLDPLDDNVYAIWLYGRQKLQIEVPAATGADAPAFSILMPVYNATPEHLRAALDSVLAQTWGDWELCMADDASPDAGIREIITEYANKDARIKFAFRASNGGIAEATSTALGMAQKTWCAFLDQDDLLAPEALACMARAITQNPQGRLFYSDEDKVKEYDQHFYPHFKNNKWDWELIGIQNFVCHLAVYERDRLVKIGGLRKGFEGAQDYDLVLRYINGMNSAEIVHVPELLYHSRAHAASTAMNMSAKDYAAISSLKVAQAYLDIVSPGAVAEPVPGRQWLRTKYPFPDAVKAISIIIEIGANAGILSAVAKARPANCELEIICVCAPEQLNDVRNNYGNICPHILEMGANRWETVNQAAKLAAGDVLGFIGPNVIPCDKDWLPELASALWRPDVGAVGGSVRKRDGCLADGGWLTDCSHLLKPIFAGATAVNYWGWGTVQRTVDALSGDCLFTRKRDFVKIGGFDAGVGDMAAQDYCLRLGARGLRSVWWPYALFVSIESRQKGNNGLLAFHKRWAGKLDPFNPNLRIDGDMVCLDASPVLPDD